jgi:dihydrofolate reductase
MDLHGWRMRTAHFAGASTPGATWGLDDTICRDFDRNIGAEIMGRRKFTPETGPWTDETWIGWWGDNPPFHTPVFVLTHYERPPLTLDDTTFYFVNATPEEALRLARAAAQGKDVRIGGGVATVRSFLDANLVDIMHVAETQFISGCGERLWNRPGELDDRYHHETIPSPSGVTHHFFWRR